MKKPVLVIMAAGMGSRYGGLKQIDPVGRNGEIILDYSLFDAKRAGFEKAIIVIKRENEALFREVIGDRASRQMEIQYAYQEMDDLPEGFSIPESRKKPWGTGHAVLAARKLVDAPFCAINADDFYGAEASTAHQFVCTSTANPEKFCGFFDRQCKLWQDICIDFHVVSSSNLRSTHCLERTKGSLASSKI